PPPPAIMSYIPLLSSQLPSSPLLVSETSDTLDNKFLKDGSTSTNPFIDSSSSTLPTSTSSTTSLPPNQLTYPSNKRLKLSSPPITQIYTGTITSILHLPSDLLHLILSYSTPQSYYAVGLTCRVFLTGNGSRVVMEGLGMEFGKGEGRERGILDSVETREQVLARVNKFALQGNVEAQYYLGVVKLYGFDVEEGVEMLRKTAKKEHVKSMYALGIAIRDCRRTESNALLESAGSYNYYPALSEILDNTALKQRFKEPNAEQLKEFMMPGSLNRYLKRVFVEEE
ncbi:hypothetical protein TrLO_g5516, partial [Triparma laevis f. longispina]